MRSEPIPDVWYSYPVSDDINYDPPELEIEENDEELLEEVYYYDDFPYVDLMADIPDYESTISDSDDSDYYCPCPTDDEIRSWFSLSTHSV
ncbi:uncharacterized protein LOC6740325 isoform X2 [Drosophila simulans]|nr:uncharacterized protein LOC6740325 isoform X2 [Drosophila simulans]XP_016039433.1 uncharacterized protein LOC6740325 isoform X2 [Drosophila simulans]KMZ09898.1 uncharacterized protein Dsimw501_GD24560, isoform C [Drosophila simulans]KMZ09899.1 uncharacterized protein Dsimw501_GD24560, isoform D [Drosophila simulans]